MRSRRRGGIFDAVLLSVRCVRSVVAANQESNLSTSHVTRLVPVPTRALHPQLAHPSGVKGYDRATLRMIMSQVPALYGALESGKTACQIAGMERSHDPAERSLATTARHLFATSPSSRPLRADLDQGQLTLVDGNHRVFAAGLEGVPFVPVKVTARSQQELQQVVSTYHRLHGESYLRALAVHERETRGRAAAVRESRSHGRDRTR